MSPYVSLRRLLSGSRETTSFFANRVPALSRKWLIDRGTSIIVLFMISPCIPSLPNGRATVRAAAAGGNAEWPSMDAKQEIAQSAARLVVEEGLEYGPAKRRAVKQLGQ